MELIAHHQGCAVKTLEGGLSTYSGALMLKRRTRAFEVSSQNVSVCFLELRAGFYLELVAPNAGQSMLANYLKAGFYHLCFLTEDIAASQIRLEKRGFCALPRFGSEAFAGRSCQFFISPERHLIELAQMSPQGFEDFFVDNIERGETSLIS